MGDPLGVERYAVGIVKASAGLREFVDGALRQIKADGRWRRLHQRWLGRYGPTPAPP